MPPKSARAPNAREPSKPAIAASVLDRNAWLARHVLPHEPRLRTWLKRHAVTGLEVDDIVQETYAILAGLADVSHIDSPRAYASQTAKSLILRHVRRARIVRFDPMSDMDLSGTAADEPSPEHQVATRQELRRVSEIIAGLPARCGEAFHLRRVHGHSQLHVAALLGISESTVEKHVGRALGILASSMKTVGPSRLSAPVGEATGQPYTTKRPAPFPGPA